MATETSSGLSDHLRGVTVTTIACLAGLGAAIASGYVVGTGAAAATDRLSLVVLAAFVLVELPIMRLFGVDVGEFGAKDYLYVVFMTAALWFIAYGVLLSTSAPVSV